MIPNTAWEIVIITQMICQDGLVRNTVDTNEMVTTTALREIVRLYALLE